MRWPSARPPARAIGVQPLDQVLTARQVEGMIDVWHRFPYYRVVGSRPSRVERPSLRPPLGPRLRFAPGLSGRADLDPRLDRLRAEDPVGTNRDSYLRETYADSGEPGLVGITPFLSHPNLVDAAGEAFDATRIVPWYVYANVLLPGQELGPHQDIPEFRGFGKSQAAGWLLIVMAQSGLFERWRIPVATAVWYPLDEEGGAFRYATAEGWKTVAPVANRAVLFDADAIVHGVARVPGDDAPLVHLRAGARLLRMDHRSWVLMDRSGAGATMLAEYRSDQLRYSVSWKAFCFADQVEFDRWATAADDLPVETILPCLRTELEARGRLASGDQLTEDELGRLLIDEFVPLPA
jgi:hypothetical protein